MPESRVANGTVGFALQILLVLLLLIVNSTTQAASCPTGMTVTSYSGNATNVIQDIGVDYETQALGAPSAINTTTSSNNSALVAAGDTLGLDLGIIIPAGSTLNISLARNNSTGRVRIETSLDNSSYTSVGTFGNTSTLGTGTTDILGQINVTIPTGSARYIRFVREAGGVWVDAVSYSQVCATATFGDHGDAPATYGDARHALSTANIYLGATPPDYENTSENSFNALGDGLEEDSAPHTDSANGPYEAARFPVLKMTDTSYSTPITVTNTSGTAGKLYGWIDFNKNGTFEAGEGTSANVPTGSNEATINLAWNSIPVDIQLGTTYIRLRLTTDSSITTSTPMGSVSNGEVEDYPIAIYQHIPPDSTSLSIVNGAIPMACQQVILTDDFNDIGGFSWGANKPGSQEIRNWVRSGGGTGTYAYIKYLGDTQEHGVYFGNGAVRGIAPDFHNGFTFDANGHLTTPITAIALRDVADDFKLTAEGNQYGPESVKLSRSVPTVVGKKYRLYFKAIPEEGSFSPGIMRVDAPGGSIHFKAPGSSESTQNYAIEFTATSTTSTIAFINYGHVSGDWCNPQSDDWCTTGGTRDGTSPNELIVDDVVLAEALCNTGAISGTVYTDSNGNSSYDSGTESGIGFITVSVYDEKFTPTDTADDTLITTTSTSANGSYSFSGLDSGLTYRIQVETNLPSGATIGTTNPLSGKVVTAGGTLTNQNFGFNPQTSCNTSNGDFGGTVFRDYDGDGTQNLLETGLGGVTVTAYSNTNSAVSTATTANNGVYKLTGLTVGSQYRLEFTNLPSYTEPGIHSATSATSVRFITVSASCDNHFAVQSPAEYCQANPHIAVPTYTYGDSSASKVGPKPGIYTFPYSATGDASNRTSNPTQKTTIGQTGATWGTAYQASTKTLYTAAVMRRFVGFGTLSTGGIYKLDMSNPAAASTGATNYIDVRTLGIPTGDDVRDSTTCNKLATTTSSPSHDIAAWDAVGKVGIGDIDYDDTSRTLWLVNLNDRKLYGIRNISPTTPPVAADVAGGYAINLPAPYTCTSGTFRPWAVKYYRGQVYVGGVCDASSAPVTANLKGYVLKFDPANTAAGFSYVKDIPLGYNHPIDLNNPVGAWKGWISAAEAVAAGAPTNSAQHSPIISNLEFDTDGSIIVGIIDRAAMQNGDNAQNVPSCTNTSTSNPDLTGDILRLCKTDTGYISDSEPGCKTDIPANIKMQDEYYWGDYGIYPNLAGNLREIATGGLALVPGTGEVVSTTYDDSAWLTNEIMWLNNQTGAANDRYYLGTNLMGKAAGMGDIEVLCDPAPTEVGNRVWLDTNKDGIQDAGEAGINNVTVTLACGTDTATATTNTAGEYYFSNKTGGNATFMDAGESCTLKVNGSQTSLS
ncbi:MAG: SdrD B-like domain-containing protein, partial [Thiothrix litoralis]